MEVKKTPASMKGDTDPKTEELRNKTGD